MKQALGVFPALDRLGGVEASGRTAWNALRRVCGEESRLFTYQADRPDSKLSKLGAVGSALRGRQPARLVLVWHLGLLKLVPFLVRGDAPVVLFLHGVEAWRRHDAVTSELLRRVSLFLTNTGFTWSRFLELNPEFAGASHQTIHLGLGDPVREDVASSAEPAAVMVGRMSKAERYKGHDEVIGAWPEVLRTVPNAKLWIAGTGDYREDLETRAKAAGLGDAVRFFGAVSEEVKHDLIARSRALLLPSRGEGFGLAYLEAMRLGRPSLASTVDAGREVVNPPECGLAADPADGDAIREAIMRLLTEGAEWARWSAQCRKRYEERFTEARFERRLSQAIEGVLS